MFSSRLPSSLSFILFLTLLPLVTHAYFVVTSPAKGNEWVNGQTYSVQWTKGLLDGIDFVDLEFLRMNTDGILLVAQNIPSKSGGLNIKLESIPAGSDYFAVFLNSTHGGTYATSQMFSVLDSGTSNSSSPPISSKPTVTISGAPNPTGLFVATYTATSGGVRAWHPPAALLSAGFVSLAMFAGALAVL
jgi:hypothetical protein